MNETTTDSGIILPGENGKWLVNGEECNNPDGVCVAMNTGGNRVVLYDPHPKQLEFHGRTEPNVLFWGGRGSGKSMALRWEAHMRALAHPGFTYIILRRTYPELQKSHLIHVPREMRQLGGVFHYTDRVATYPNGSKGFFSHCQSEEDVLNLLSAEFAWAGFDELSTFEWDMFTKLSASVRVPLHSGLTAMVRAATNPLGPSAAKILEYFVEKQVDPEEDPDYVASDWTSVHANLEDNPSLDREQYKKRFSGLAAHVRKAWVDGEFILENALFDMQPKREGKPYHVVTDLNMKEVVNASTIYRAIDAGWFPDPTICLWIAHLGNRYIVLKEKLWYKTVASDIAAEIKEVDASLGITRVAMTYCDPSMNVNTTADVRTVRDVYEMNGIPMESSINNREMFASSVHTALQEEAEDGVPRIQFYASGRLTGCPYLVKTIPQQRYNPKHPLAMADHKDDHGVVALAYFLISSSSMERHAIESGGGLRRWMRQKDEKRFVLGHDNVREPR